MSELTREQRPRQHQASPDATKSNSVSSATRRPPPLLMHLQSAAGNRAVGRFLHPEAPAAIQAKPKISTPGDAYEQEADRVAEEIAVGGMAAVSDAPQGGPTIRRKCGACLAEEREDEPSIMAKSEAGGPAGARAADAASAVSRGGTPLAAGPRAYFEDRFGRDFSLRRARERPHDPRPRR